MAKKTRYIILTISIVAAILSSTALCIVNFSNRSYNASNNFREQLVDIYKKYDSSSSSTGAFSLRRLIISNYNASNTYGASDYAFDKKHSIAVLQYETQEQAKNAYNQIKADGYLVDADSKAVLNSGAKGSIYPEGSNAVGTPSFLSKFAMNRDDVIVAVIDTGVMYDHEAMENRFYGRGYDFSDDGRNNAYYDTSMEGSYYGHGTFVCGIIADNTPDNVKILPYKAVAFGDSDASNSAIVASIYDAVDKGASVISVSLSASSGANAIKYAVNTALSKGVCICASAGNDGKEIKYRYPATTEGVITASALENDFKTFADFSNYGKAIDFCAPGRKVVSACPYKSGGEKYATNSGTSFSAPYIAAVCANIKSINKNFTKDEVYEIICDFAVDLGDEGYDIYYGNGLPNLSNMVYTDGKSYSFSIPEGSLNVYESRDYTEDTQPWRLFADRLLKVTVNESVERIGSYAFNNMPLAEFIMADTYNDIGDYAFYGCRKLDGFTFGMDVNSIGANAFGGMNDGFTVSGYRNTAAEAYAQRENIKFNILGCKHNYVADVVDPTEEEDGYTVYTCTVCGDTYIGEYIEPPEYYSGDCGMGVSWRYTTKTKELEISGNGYMFSYSSKEAVPWYIFMNKIKSVVIGENITYLSDYILSDAVNAQNLTVYSKQAEFRKEVVVFSQGESNLTIYAYDDSNTRDYCSNNNISYVSLGCGHSREITYFEEQPSCCYDTYGVFTCTDCKAQFKEYISVKDKGHYLKGTIKTTEGNAVYGAEVYVDGKLSAITNAKGKYIVYPVFCGNCDIVIKKHNCDIFSSKVTVERSNTDLSVEMRYGDFNGNGYVNAKDFAYALKNNFDDLDILDYGKPKKSEILMEKYDTQELPYVLRLYNEPNDDSSYKRDFTAVIENNSEFEIKESGFIYGKNMSDEMLFLERVGETNSDGYAVKMKSTTDNTKYEKVLSYGSSSSTGTISARFYIIYTNGVKDYTYYSEVTSYTY